MPASYLDRSRSRFCDRLEARGVYAHRYALGRWFVSLAHGPAEIEQTLDAVRGAVEDLAA